MDRELVKRYCAETCGFKRPVVYAVYDFLSFFRDTSERRMMKDALEGLDEFDRHLKTLWEKEMEKALKEGDGTRLELMEDYDFERNAIFDILDWNICPDTSGMTETDRKRNSLLLGMAEKEWVDSEYEKMLGHLKAMKKVIHGFKPWKPHLLCNMASSFRLGVNMMDFFTAAAQVHMRCEAAYALKLHS